MIVCRMVPAIEAALDRGDAVAVLAQVPGDIENARAVSRAMCRRFDIALRAARLQVSRSATPGLAGVALRRHGGIGIDVERIRSAWVDNDLRELALHPAERAAAHLSGADAFFAIWTRKEALLKALGVGLAVSPVSFATGGIDLHWAACDLQPVGSGHVRSLLAPDGFCAAVGTPGCQVGLQSWVLPHPPAQRHFKTRKRPRHCRAASAASQPR